MNIVYDDNNYKFLMSKLQTITTFQDINTWDNLARQEVARIVSVIHQLDSAVNTLNMDIQRAEAEHQSKGFLQKVTSSQVHIGNMRLQIQQCFQYRAHLEAMGYKLHEAIDFTPNSREEQQALISELKMQKKELQSRKKEINLNQRLIRNDARQMSANAGHFWGMYSGKVAATERRHLRYAREAALQPHENEKTAIERQLIQIERDIMWAERFN